MRQRACVHVSTYRPAFGGDPPPEYIPFVTVDLRVQYPPSPWNYQAAVSALNEAYNEARHQLWNEYQEGQHE